MLKNHFLVAFRNLWRNKTFSFIHILGLSIGLSASLVICLIVKYELSFDHFEKDNDRIYRIVMNYTFNGMHGTGASIPGPLPNAIQAEVTGVEANIPIMMFQGDSKVDVVVPTGSDRKPRTFKAQADIVFTAPDYFKILPYEFVAGSVTQALSEPFSVVLTEGRAHMYFPDHANVEILGKQITYNRDLNLTVTGIVKDLDETTDFKALEFISYSTISKTALQSDFMMEVWDDGMAYSKGWVKLTSENDKAGVEAQMNSLLKKNNKSLKFDAANNREILLQPLSDVHFNSTYGGYGDRTAHAPTLYGLLAIAGFLLLLGCINFVNLSTAQASLRAKEIGIRKTIGSTRKQLIMQFMSETLLVTILATVLSISIVPILLQMFADFIPPGLNIEFISEPTVIAFIFFLTLIVSLFAGFYPAIVLSRFRPAVVLKNQAFAGSPTRSAGLRKVLTVSQFAVAQFFVIAAFMVSKQIHFSINQDLGYRKEAIITFEMPRDTVADHAQTIQNAIIAIPGVQKVSKGFMSPAMEGGAFANISFHNGAEEISPGVQVRWGDPEFINVYDIPLLAGRNIREGKNVNEALINEAYAKDLGFESVADAVGRELIQRPGANIRIVGVMQDFHEGSTHQPIGAVVFKASATGRVFHVALDPNRGDNNVWQGAIEKMKTAYLSIYPESEFRYKFFDDTIAAFYKKEQDTSRLLNWAMGLSILISCLGLLGLVIYISGARSKEIGIRKILGASIASIVGILSKEFVMLVVIAFVIAGPAAWYAIDQWLEGFVYRTEMSWWVFAASGVVLMLIAMITLSAQTIKTATSNPVKSLRTE